MDYVEPKQTQVRIQVPLVEAYTQTEQWVPSNQPAPVYSQTEGLSEERNIISSISGVGIGREKTLRQTDILDMDSIQREHLIPESLPISSQSKSRSPSDRTRMSGYLIALRPWSFTASITPVALGSCLAYKSMGVFNFPIFATTVLTALCVHAAGNLVNTYFDFVRGVDNKKSDDRTLVDSILHPNDVVRLAGILYIIGCVGFTVVSFLSTAKMEHLALIYFCGLSSSFFYTGGLGLKYIAMGDILIVLTFGPLTVVFSFLSQTGQLSLAPLLYALPLALNTEAILHCNNTRDMEGDKQAGAITVAILLGKTGSYILFCFLLFVPYIAYITVGIHFCKWILLPATSIFIAFRLEKEFRRGNLAALPQAVAQLNLVMGLLYIVALFMSDWSSLPSMSGLGS